MAIPIWTGSISTVFSTAGNWTTGVAPTGADTVIFDWNATQRVAGSDQTGLGTSAFLYIRSTVPAADYIGDQATALKLNATSWRIGDAALGPIAGTHANRINLDFGTVVNTGVIVGTSTSSADTGQEPVRIKGVNVSNLWIVQGGLVGFATNAPADVGTASEIDVLGGQANIGSGMTLAKVKQTAGIANVNCALSTELRQLGGIATTTGSGTIAAAYCGGKTTYNSTGTITTLEITAGGNADFNQDFQSKTVTTIKMYKGSTLSLGSHVTVTNAIQLVECTLADVTINTRQNVSAVIAYL